MPDYVAKLSKKLAELERRVSQLHQSGLGTSAIEGGGIDILDQDGNYLTTVGQKPDGSFGVGYNIDSTVITPGGIETPSLAANSITADKLEAALVLASMIIAGDPEGAAAIMDQNGFRTQAVSADGALYTSTSLGNPASVDKFEIINGPGLPPVASISSDGAAQFTGVSSAGDISLGGTPLMGRLIDPAAGPGLLDSFGHGLVGIWDFRNLSTLASVYDGGTAGATGLIGQFECALPPGRNYQFMTTWRMIPQVSGTTPAQLSAAVRGFFTSTTDGSTPPDPTGAASEVGLDGSVRTPASSTTGVSGTSQVIVPINGAAWRLKMALGVYAGVNTKVQLSTFNPNDWVVYCIDVGPAAPIINAELPGNPSKKTFTTVWTATGSKVWDQNGTALNGSTTAETDYLYQGWSSDHTRFWHSAFVCNGTGVADVGTDGGATMSAALSGATISKVEVGITTTSTELDTGAELQLRPWTGSTLPTTHTASATGAVTKQPFTSRSQWKWITIPTTWISATNRGVMIGPSDWQGPESHALFGGSTIEASKRAKIRVTYTR